MAYEGMPSHLQEQLQAIGLAKNDQAMIVKSLKGASITEPSAMKAGYWTSPALRTKLGLYFVIYDISCRKRVAWRHER